MKEIFYDIRIRLMDAPATVIEDVYLPRKVLYHAVITRGPFLERKDDTFEGFEQKRAHSPTIREWPYPNQDPVELMPAPQALDMLLEHVRGLMNP